MKEVKPPRKPLFYYYGIALVVLLLINFLLVPLVARHAVQEVDYGTFMTMTENKEIGKVEVEDNQIIFTNKDGSKIYKTGPMNDPDLTQRLYDAGAEFTRDIVEQTSPLLSVVLTWVLPIVLFIAVGQLMAKKLTDRAGGPGSMMFGAGKSNAKIYVQSSQGIRFADVAGEDEAKENLQEIVNYLHDPSKYQEIGASMPKGILLVGPPGTGKTMLAKAVAGESNVPFFSISGSEFVEMFVGMGASKVRDLFRQAKEKAPCIVFIDEIDAIGQKRNSGNLGGNDEREQTLNQLLVEMDGFGANEGVIIIAATNRPDILDPALLRPGRFDRQVTVGYPDLKGREAILKVHAKGKPLGPDVDLSTIAKTTIGFTGADLENLLNEAALLAARRDKKAITMTEIEEAMIKVVAGTEKKSHKMTDKEKRLTAYHEAGHAVSAYYLEYNDPVHQVSIVPRGQMGGYTMYLPTEDKSYHSKNEMLDNLVSLLGGRVAEALIIGDVSTGASNDIERATDIARKMVTKYGMSEKLGPITFGSGNDEVFLGRDYSHLKNYSEETAAEIDEEINRIITTAYGRTEDILKEHIDRLHAVAGALIEREKISGEEFETIMHGGTLDPLSAQSDDSKPAEVPEQSDAQNNEEADGNEKESE